MVLTRYFYDFSRLVPEKPPAPPVARNDYTPLIAGLAAVAALAGIGYYLWDRKRKAKAAQSAAQPVYTVTE